MKKIIIPILIIILFSTASYSKGKMRIAIMDFQARDISLKDSLKITELIRNEMINTGKFVVVERSQMGAILEEQGFQQTGCTDVSCAVEVGKILSARKMLIGTILKLGNKIILTGRIVDVENGVAEFSEKASADRESELSSTVTKYVDKLIEQIELAEEKAMAAKGLYKKSNPYTLPGFGLTGLGLASLGGGFYFNAKIASLHSDYDSLYIQYQAAASTPEADRLHSEMTTKYDDAQTATLYRNIAYGVGAASFLAGTYFLYKFFTYAPVDEYANRDDRSMITPLLFTANPFYRVPGSYDRYFIGGGVVLRF